MSTAISIAHNNNPRVYVANGNVHIDEFVESDPGVALVVSTANDAVAAVHRILSLGAQVTAVADKTTTAVDLSETVARLTHTVAQTVDSAVEGISEATRQLLDAEDGGLPIALRSFKEQFENLLGENFNPDSKKSVVSKFESVLGEAVEQQNAKLNRALDPHAPDSLLGRLRDEVVKTVKDETADVAKQVAELREVITTSAAAAGASRAMFNRTALKGFRFEDTLHELTCRQAVHYGDLACAVGKEPGALGTLAGDEVVTLSADDTRGAEVNFVWEAKTKRVGLRKILDELGDAMANRSAAVGIAVFGDPDVAPVKVPFTQFGDKAVLVLDKEDPDEGAVRLAYMWARWVSRRKLGDDDIDLDLERIEGLLADATRSLEHTKQVRKCHTMAKKGIEEAGGHLDSMVRDVEAALTALREELDKHD